METYVKYHDHHYMSGYGYGYISGYTHYNGGTYAVVVKQENTIEEIRKFVECLNSQAKKLKGIMN